MRLVVATRRSALALAQTRAFVGLLRTRYPSLEVAELQVTTTGDRVQNRPLSDIGGKGLFVKEIEEALLEGRADLAVHSMKDVPPELLNGLHIGCVPQREDARDVVVTRGGEPLAELASGSRVGTSSLRRQVLLAAWRPDLNFVPLRGNVDTRLAKCRRGDVDAVVLARAGLARLGLLECATETLDVEISLPAVGQGALAIEYRTGDETVGKQLAPLHDAQAAICVAAERGVLAAVEGNCKLPVAAYAVRQNDELWLRAMLCNEDGSHLRRAERRAPWPEAEEPARHLGLALGAELKAA